MSARFLADLPRRHAAGATVGITSVCSAHPVVIRATLAHGLARGGPVLIEATCNQVNQDGGYTGMTPAAFRAFVEGIAAEVGFDTGELILGGDHLGPNPWKHLPADEAMAKADGLVEAYARAGFAKIHLDTSMGCAGEGDALPDEVTAGRAARLARVCEASAPADAQPLYVIGTEVPTPGGAQESLDHLAVTRPEAALRTVEVHRQAFGRLGLEAAFERAIGVVVQPGVEFGNDAVVVYDSAEAQGLSAVLRTLPQFVFEAHSTDYQPAPALAALVRDGYAILKVGPWLTFALREALYGLDQIAVALDGVPLEDTLQAAMERAMLAEPRHWQNHYRGGDDELRLQRHFSYSDRIRYYWPQPEVAGAVERLLRRLAGRRIPATLVSQYLGALYPAVATGELRAEAGPLLAAAVERILVLYGEACRPSA